MAERITSGSWASWKTLTMSKCRLSLGCLPATHRAASLRSAPPATAVFPPMPPIPPLPFPSVVTTSAPFGDPQDCQARPVSEEGVTAHSIVVSDSSLDDGPEFLVGSGVEDQRSVLHLGSTEGAVHLGAAPGLRRAQESRTPAASVPWRLRPSSRPMSESPLAKRLREAANHGKESSKFNQDCTICRPCRSKTPDCIVRKQRKNRSGWRACESLDS